jgi:type VI secretion system protein ImpG
LGHLLFRDYYQTELAYLRELGREFALANPDLANVFAEKGGDPDVERLLEGFAFLTARIRDRINDAVPEVIESLAQLLLPHYLRTVPATSVVEFTPIRNALRGRHLLPKGTELGSRPVRGTRCLFRTVADIDLLPITVERSLLDESSIARPVIRISFLVTGQGLDSIFAKNGIELFINGPIAQSSILFLWFQRHLTGLKFVNATGAEIELDRSRVRAVALDEDHTLFPWPERAPAGPRLLQEYFTQPQKLLFVRIEGTDQIPIATATERFELVFRFDRPPELVERVETGTFRVNCVPVVNLFETSAEPIRQDERLRDYLVRAAGIDPRHMDIYSIHSVIGVRGQGRKRITYKPFFDFDHAPGSLDEQAFYTVRHALSPLDQMLDTYLSCLPPLTELSAGEEETLSIELTCTNRLLPAELRTGEISQRAQNSPSLATFSNITGVTIPIGPPTGSELYWRLVAHLAVNYRSLVDPETLRALLSLYNFQRFSSQQQGRANQLRVDAVRAVSMKPTKRLLDNHPVLGIATSVEVDEGQFASVGDAYLFGCSLDSLFGAQVPVNSFNQLTLKLHPSNATLVWPPRNGNQTIL